MYEKEFLGKIREVISKILDEEGAELVEMSYGWRGTQMTLQILVDKLGGVHLDECVRLNHQISKVLDRLDLSEEKFVLEVASPGLDRPLTTDRDFERATGQAIRLFLKTPLLNRFEYEGMIEGLRGGNLCLRLAEGTLLEIPLTQVGKGKRLIHF